MSRKGAKPTCGGCGRKIYLRDGKSMSAKREIVCPRCGYSNQIKRKKNGKFIIS